MSFTIAPVHWKVDYLVKQGSDLIHDLALQAAGTTTAYRLVVGRCLLAMDRLESYREFGCSGSIHYARKVLGLSQPTANSFRWVARRLEELPRLTIRAEEGSISWCKLRLVVGKASAETEALWLKLCRTRNCRQLADLLRNTPPGGIPGDPSIVPTKPEESEIRFQLSPEARQIVERALVSLSHEVGRRVSLPEALEYFCVGRLAERPVDDEVLEKMRQEARRDLQAEGRAFSDEVVEARMLALEMGLLSVKRADAEVASDEGEGAQVEVASPSAADTVPVDDDSVSSGRGRADDLAGDGGELEAEAVDTCQDREWLEKFWRAAVGATETAGPVDGLRLLSRGRLRFNPEARTLTPAQQREIRRRDRYKCSTPHCPNHIWLDTHHVVFYCEGGATVPTNLCALCTRCHDNIHRGLLKIEGTAPDGLVFTDSRGRSMDESVATEVAGWIDFWLGWRGGEFDSHLHRVIRGELDLVPV